ncbi:mitochondrial carrier protein domain-containing protein [Purpureocillium lilacinum]|uniref:Mitochondrial carrier protein domain-containing protein n=1 Tax=Purpureocillium lilacinum TaxID=33203 RepID=A0A179FK99_PURLI|nr:mitochondrial carrier protein domain-containing protein [Purpureocillium lilacinum]
MPSRDHKLSPSWPKYIENSYPRACHHRLCPVQGTYYLADPEHPTIPFTNAAIRSFAGATSAMATSVITCPLDVVKTKLQGRGGLQLWTLDSVSRRRSFQDRGLIGTGRAIWHQEGLAGMYQGLGPTMLANLPRGLCYYIDESIMGGQDQTHVTDKYLRKERPKRIQVRCRCRSEDVLPRRRSFVLLRVDAGPAWSDTFGCLGEQSLCDYSHLSTRSDSNKIANAQERRPTPWEPAKRRKSLGCGDFTERVSPSIPRYYRNIRENTARRRLARLVFWHGY